MSLPIISAQQRMAERKGVKLLMLGKEMESKGGKLILCEIGPEIQEVFATTKLNRIFDIRESEADALEEFD